VTVYGDIEAGIVALIESIDDGGQPLFVEVRGALAADRKRALERLSRAHTPGAAVMVDGRQRVGADADVPGSPQVTVWLAARNVRSSDSARLGDVDGPGVFALSETVISVLDGAMVADTWRLTLIAEQVVAADERTAVFEQRWQAQAASASTLPTYGGEVITGPASVVTIVVGNRVAESVPFSFPGVDGVFEHAVGVGSRRIEWSGTLHGDDDDALNAIETAIEALTGDGNARDVVDVSGRTFENCVLSEFRRRGPRDTHPTRGTVAQGFELRFHQLAG